MEIEIVLTPVLVIVGLLLVTRLAKREPNLEQRLMVRVRAREANLRHKIK